MLSGTILLFAADASGEWKSIGGENIDFVTGAANRVVQTGGTDLEINWRADRSWPNHVIPDGCARAVVTAWATNDAPNYMVVARSKANPEINFYADASFMPGGAVAWSLLDDRGLLEWTSCNDVADLRAARPTLDDGEHPLSVANRVTFGDSSEIPRFNDGVLIQTEKSGRKFGKRVPTIEPGIYTLAVSVGREDGTPTIALPLEGGRDDRRYPVGKIEVLAS